MQIFFWPRVIFFVNKLYIRNYKKKSTQPVAINSVGAKKITRDLPKMNLSKKWCYHSIWVGDLVSMRYVHAVDLAWAAMSRGRSGLRERELWLG